ncbi:hypothetical protein AGMMS49992_17030 [Clostridia bacterium]|nr:hypothetical protein AGMMS49992_17030 [Clostridia bacterium]
MIASRRKRIAALSAVLVLCAAVWFAVSYQRNADGIVPAAAAVESLVPGVPFEPLSDEGDGMPGMALAARSDHLKLYTNPATAEIAVLDTRTGAIAYSNPPAADMDPIANPINKSVLKSQLIVQYYDTNRLRAQYNSYDSASSLGQIALEAIPGGIRYTYTLGDMSSKTGIVPVYITQERLDTVLERLDPAANEAEIKNVQSKYRTSRTAEGFLELIASAQTGKATLKRLSDTLIKAGYTQADYQADMLAAGAEDAVPKVLVVPLEYRLEGDSLLCTVPVSGIEERSPYRIYRVQLLRYFGAAGSDTQGYALLPNGSGSLMRFNNGKTSAEDYGQYVYGRDPLAADYITLGNTENARLPVFGLCRDDMTLLAVIEDGDALAQINASVAGKLNAYNYAYAAFTLRGGGTLAMFGAAGNEAELPVVEPDLYDINASVRYIFLTPENGGYVGMANAYRDRLTANGVLHKLESREDIPFYMDVLCAQTRDVYTLGIRRTGIQVLTTFSRAQDMIVRLTDAGVKRPVVNLQGWFNNGYYHDAPDRADIVRALGTPADLAALTAITEQAGGGLYADVAFQQITRAAPRFDWRNQAARYFAGGMVAVFGQVNPITLQNVAALGYPQTQYDLLSPKYLPSYVNKFINAVAPYDLTGISLRDLADELHSDKKRSEPIDRQAAQWIVTDAIRTMADRRALLLAGGNAYALAYTNDLIGAPLSHSALYMLDAEVPFYQMVVHGSIRYAGDALNLMGLADDRDTLLRMIEFGASPRFTFTHESSSAMKNTALNRMYSTTFDRWLDDAASSYAYMNASLRNTDGAYMIDHEVRPSGLRAVAYDNGVTLYINRTNAPITDGGVTVPAMSYMQEGGKP